MIHAKKVSRCMNRKLILLELNEVPYRVIDSYCQQRPKAMLTKMLCMSKQFETVTEDRLALDPWVSWPTLHRGVNDEEHNILHLGQVVSETDEKFPPIWQLLKRQGLRVGIFGSLHSSTRPSDAYDYSFYLPDYFDGAAFAHPANLESFQELNLSMTRQSARNVTRRIPAALALKFAAQAPMIGLKLSTFVDAVCHLVRETFDDNLRIRRRAYQPLVTMDLFLHQLKQTKPDFATFYTNHVAAAMHRYWGATFPADYGEDELDQAWVRKYSAEITFAMDKCDVMLGHLAKFIDENPEYTLMVASSMGQAAIRAIQTYSFLTIVDTSKFMAFLGVPGAGWELRPAMVPCCCVVVSEEYRDLFVSNIDTLVIDGETMKRDRRPTGRLSYDERDRGFFQIFIQFDSYSGPNTALLARKSIELTDLGLGFMPHEDGVNCTAQHVREGSLWLYSKDQRGGGKNARETISTLDVAPSILSFFEREIPRYMRGSVSIGLQ
jgi:Type I phosphodiesterase / nucleotide pyrophosphatase